jgi:hypothetical protein
MGFNLFSHKGLIQEEEENLSWKQSSQMLLSFVKISGNCMLQESNFDRRDESYMH